MRQLTIIGMALILGIGLAAAKNQQKHPRHHTSPPISTTSTFGNGTTFPTQFRPAQDLSVCPGYGYQSGLCDRPTGSH